MLHDQSSPLLDRSPNLLSFTESSNRLIQLVNLGITQVLVKLLINVQHADTIPSEVLAHEVLWLLGQVSIPLLQSLFS